MPITVKSYQRQVQPDTARVPDPINPGAVRGAFGENVYQANQAIGQQVSNIGAMLGKHAIEQKNLQDDAFVAEQNIKDSMVLDGMLNNAENETIDLNGQKIERPKGVLNRMGLNTQGSTNEFDTKYQKYSSQVLSGIKDERLRQRVSLNMLRNYSSAKNTVVSHEAKQYRAGLIDKIEGEKKLNIDLAYSVRNHESLNHLIAQVAISQDKINNYKGVDNATAQINFNEAIKNTISNSAMGALKDDPTGGLSRDLLKKTGNGIDDKSYDAILGDIDAGSKKLMTQIKEQNKLNQLSTESKVVTDFLSGDIGSVNPSDVGRMVNEGKIRPEFGNALIRAISNPIPPEEIDYDVQDKAFVNSLDAMFDASQPEDVNNAVIGMLESYSDGELDQKKMTLLVQTALKHGGNNRAFRNMMNLAEDNSLDTAEASRQFVSALNEGKPPSVAAQMALVSVGFTDEKMKEYAEKEKSILGYSGNVQPSKGKGMNPILEPIVNAAKGGAAALFSSPQVYGAMLKEYGENVEENRNFWTDLINLPNSINSKIIESIPFFKERQDKAKEKAVQIGQSLIDDNLNWISQQKLTRPEASGLNQVAYDLGSGGASILTVLGMAVVTKNPVAISAMFGAISKAHAYEELRKSGKSPSKSSELSTIAGTLDFGIQLVGLKFMLKNYGGRLVNAAVRSAALGAQSGVQSISSDVTLDRGKNISQIMHDAGYNALIGFALGFSTSAIVDMAVKDGTVRRIKQNTAEVPADANPKTVKLEQDIEPQTDFGRKLKQYMQEKEKVPLHPAEEGKAAVNKLVDREQSNIERLIAMVDDHLEQTTGRKEKGVAGSKKQQVKELPRQFDNPNDPIMLDYLSEFIKPKVVAGLNPADRLKIGNLSVNELRSISDLIGKESNLKDFDTTKAKVVILDAINGVKKEIEPIIKEVESIAEKLNAEQAKKLGMPKPEKVESPLNKPAKESPNEALMPTDEAIKVEDVVAPPKSKAESPKPKESAQEVKAVETPKQEVVKKKSEPSKVETNKSEDIVGGSEKKAKASTDINKSIVEKGIKELSDEELAGFTSIKKQEQIEKVSNILQDYKKAVDMAMGREEIPSDVARQVLFNAVKGKALLENDINTLMELANSPLAKGRSLAAQELGSAGFNNEVGTDPVKAISEINKTAEEAVFKATKSKSIKEASEKSMKEVKDVVGKSSKVSKNKLANFIKGLQC